MNALLETLIGWSYSNTAADFLRIKIKEGFAAITLMVLIEGPSKFSLGCVISHHLGYCNPAGLFASQHCSLPSPIPISISDNQIAFIIVAKTQRRRQEIKALLDEYTRRHLAIYD